MNWINELLGKTNDTLREILFGIVLWGTVFSLAFVWTGDSGIVFLASLWAGAAVAAFMAVHMYRTIDRTLDLPADDAALGMKKGAVLRAAVAMGLFVAVWRLHGNILGVFLGLFTLKLGAYSQPLAHKVMEKRKRR